MVEWVVVICFLCWIVVFQLELVLLLRIHALLYRVVLSGFVVGKVCLLGLVLHGIF